MWAVSAAWLALSCRVGYEELVELTAGGGGVGAGAAAGSSSDAGGANGAIEGGAPSNAGSDGGGAIAVGGEGGGAAGTSPGGSGGAAGNGGAAGSDGSGGVPTGCRLETFRGHDYAFCDSGLELASAVAECVVVGMYGVRIDDIDEQTWVHSQIPQADQDNNSTAVWRWIGATDSGETGDWSWGDGEQFWTGGLQGSAVSGLYDNWVGNHPLNTRYCAAMEARSGGWYAMPCSQARPYVCERY